MDAQYMDVHIYPQYMAVHIYPWLSIFIQNRVKVNVLIRGDLLNRRSVKYQTGLLAERKSRLQESST